MAGPLLTVTVLGCSGSYPGPGNACSGYLVRHVATGTTVWLDAGSGTMANLQHHVALDDVDAVILTHEHPDHWTDLESFRVWARYGPGKSGIPVYGPRAFRHLTPRRELAPTLVWHDVGDGDRVDIDGLTVTFRRTDHMVETLAVRIDTTESGRSASLG